MAFLEKIRKRTWLILSVIGLSLFALIVNPRDIIKFFSGDPNIVGKVNRQEITLKEFFRIKNIVNKMQEKNPYKIPESRIDAQVWDSLVREKIIKEQIHKSGLWLSKKKEQKLLELIPSSSRKKNDEYFELQKNFLFHDYLKGQYYEMIQLGLNNTSFESSFLNKERSNTAHINYVLFPYSKIEEEAQHITIEDKEIEAYLQKHKDFYEIKEEMRDLALVSFHPKVSKQDEIDIKKEIERLAIEFKTTKDDSLFAHRYSDFPTYNNHLYITHSSRNLPEYLKNFFKDASIGSLYGPIKEESLYLMAKLTDKKMISPATKSSHILISHKEAESSLSKREKKEAKKIAEDIFNAINANPNEFDTLAKKSEDPGYVQNKGDLGWSHHKNSYPIDGSQAFIEDVQNFIDENPKGKLGLVESPFGFHIIRIDDKKPLELAYQLAFVIKSIRPSKETEKNIEKQAKEFLQKNKQGTLNAFIDNARKNNYEFILSEGIKYSDDLIKNLGSKKDSDIINWSFEKETQKNQAKLFSTPDGSYIVAFIANIKAKGLPSVKEVGPQIKLLLRKEKLFDYFQTKNKTKQIDKLETLGEVKTSKVNFHDLDIQEEGKDVELSAASFALPMNQIHGPIKGENGVYFLRILKRETLKKDPILEESTSYKHPINMLGVFIEEALINQSSIKDYRKKVNLTALPSS